jgi:hypothetical protein
MKTTEKIFDVVTGEETIIERDETVAEKKAREKFQADLTAQNAAVQTKETQRQTIAERLGLTADELQVLLG